MSERRTFYGVQVLRAMAAIMVVTVHVAGTLTGSGENGGPRTSYPAVPSMFFGNGGVDLFFLISGFVIVWTTQDEWQHPNAWRAFLDKRLTRVLPLYWALTTAKVLVVLGLPSLLRGTHLEPWNTVASYLLIPSFDAGGHLNPIISAGWTLCYEMAFYYVCTLCLVFRRRPIAYVAPLLVVLGLVGILRQPGWGAAASLIDPLLIEFACGMWLAEMARRRWLTGNTGALLVIFVLGLAGWVASEWIEPASARAWRVVVWGGPGVLILYAVLGLEARVPFRRFRLALLLGNASYSIYLAHVLVLPVVLGRMTNLVLPGYGQWLVLVLLVSMGIASGVAVWWLVERKILRILLEMTRPARETLVARGTIR